MDPYAEALERFGRLYAEAQAAGLIEPTAMTVATADASGVPSARTILLKGYDEHGFVFYTNTLSRKGAQLAENPRAALCFFWPPLKIQVHVEGGAQPVGQTEADEYWATRPRVSQLGAWASHQSETLSDRQTLLDRVAEFESRYSDQDVPRPPHWSGYRVLPERIEFWTAGEFRLHHRECYEKGPEGWSKRLLNP